MAARSVLQHVTEIAPEDDVLIIHMSIKSGGFESKIEIPLAATEKEKNVFIERWLSMMAAGLKCGETAKALKAKETTT